MRMTVISLSAMIILAGMPLTARAQATAEEKPVNLVPVGNKVCPVSGEKISADSGMAPATYIYKDKIYNLCCSGCVEEFSKNPEKYSKIADEEVAKSQKPSVENTAQTGHQM